MTENIYKQTLKMVIFTVLCIAALKFSRGYLAPVFMLAGVWCAFSGKIGWALVYYVLMPFMMILNNALLPKSGAVLAYSMRFGPLLIGMILAMMASSRRGHHRLPLGAMFPFLCAAALSSLDGWAPSVSYMKLINFCVFLLGIWFGTQNLQKRPKDVFILRSFFLAMAVVVIIGGIAVMPFPSISYATSLRYAMAEGGAAYAEDVFRTMQAEGERTLFCGVMCHSQMLAPVLSSFFAFLLCDMLFLERRFKGPHLVLIVLALPLLYLTRSRVALVTLTFALFIIFFYTMRKVRLPSDVRQKVGKGMVTLLFFIFIAAGISQLHGGGMSQWIRKTGDTEGDRRSLREALTASRVNLMEYSLYEFRRNPLFGSGFQVAEYTRDMVKNSKGLIISSPIEKGVLPVMVLGETGILGEACFIFFLLSFFFICSRRNYYITITTFSVFLMTNMGEATFFSPGGGGGLAWMLSSIGGFTLDTILLFRKNLEQQWAQMAFAAEQARIAAAKRGE